MACARNELERLSYAHNNANAISSHQQQQQQQQMAATTTTTMMPVATPSTTAPQHLQSTVVLTAAPHGGSFGSAQQQQHQPRSNYRFKISPHPSNPQDNGGGGGSGGGSGTNDGIIYKDLLPQDEIPQITRNLPSPCPQDERINTVRRRPADFHYDWQTELNADGGQTFFAADVTNFPHVPGYEMWCNIGVGMKVEVENTDCDSAHAPSGGSGGASGVGSGSSAHAAAATPHSFWVASVLRICGYKALLRYEGFAEDGTRDFWVNLCSSEVHPVGWCATRGKPLIPPRSIENRFADWKEFLVRHLSGARTLPSTFYNKIRDSFRSRFRTGLQIEVVDKNHISQVKLATVHKIVGKRLFVKYFDAPPDDNGFWCHEDSSLIHPVGWASTVGHNLAAPMEYLERMAGGPNQMIEACEDDSIIDLFHMNFKFEDYYEKEAGQRSTRPCFERGMKLEAVDPLNLSAICVATVMAVLKYGYMMIRIDSYEADQSGADWFCYHERSPCIFPPGFCDDNHIVLTPPRGFDAAEFHWNEYLIQTGSLPASLAMFERDVPAQQAAGFQVGMKLECADLMDPRLVCVATVDRVVGRLLKVHFDGWEDEYDQWLDCESPDMYPVGWCVLVGHKLEGPPAPVRQSAASMAQTAAAVAAQSAAAQAASQRHQVSLQKVSMSSQITAKSRKRKKKGKVPLDIDGE